MDPGFDFANILFAGPCNRSCPFCIGKEVPEALSINNLDTFPPANWDGFVSEVMRLDIRELVFTGTTTDPHLYRHEAELVQRVRTDLPQARLSIHTNGALSLKKMQTFNLYDRACISFPSFIPATYARMMGTQNVPDLKMILARSEIPVKVSCIVNEHNIAEVEGFLVRLAELGVKRAVLRRLFGDSRVWNVLAGREAMRHYRGNPVFDVNGMEVTWWNFATTTSRSINLFADGTIGSSYLLTQTSLCDAP
jgi:MoaA/NifB/PqqE/SkfB family radical SAM enzyme